MKAEWRDLGDKGFLIVPQFLSTAELELIRSDYDLQSSAPPTNSSYVGKKKSTYDPRFATRTILDHFEPKLRSVSEAVLAATGIDTDVTVTAMYFAIDRGINTPWHQDHESYFLFQEHWHYLNFYIPIVKPKATESNVCVLPFDALRKNGPEFYSRLKGGGAARFVPNGFQTTVNDDETQLRDAIRHRATGRHAKPERGRPPVAQGRHDPSDSRYQHRASSNHFPKGQHKKHSSTVQIHGAGSAQA